MYVFDLDFCTCKQIYLYEKDILAVIYQSDVEILLCDSFADVDFGDKIEPLQSINEINDLALKFCGLVTPEFDEGSSGAACELCHKHANEFSYFEVFLIMTFLI